MPPDNDVQAEIEQLEQRFAENSKGLVFAHLADAYRRAAQYAKAEGLILHGLKNHPSYTTAYNVLGRVYLDTERYADAHQQFSKVLELDPQNLIALRSLGDLAVRGGRLDDARVWYERMLQVDPRNEEAKEELRKLEAGIAGVSPTPAAAGDVEEIPRVEPEIRAEEAAPVVEGDVPESLPWEPGPEAGLAEAAAPEAAEDETAAMAGAEPVEATPAEPEVAAREPTPGVSARGSIELDLGEMEEWTPGFLRDEDLTGEGGGDLTPDELFADLGPAAAPREADEAGPGLVTETMAELYAQQGLYEDAIDVYRQLSAIRPNDEHIRNRMEELRQLAESVAAGEEVAERSELAEPPAAEVSEVSDTEVQAAPTETPGGFTFDDEAPVAGMEQLDPFAASFDVFAMRVEPAAPRVPETQVGLPAADVSELEPVALEELEETVALEELREEVALEAIQVTEPFADVMPAGADVTPPAEVEPPALALATPEPAVGVGQAAEPVTIEEYLAGLLAFSPELSATPQTGGAEGPADAGRSAVDAETSDDMEAFQAWLKGLKR